MMGARKKGTTKMTNEEAVKQANEVRVGIEREVDDLAAHFEGGIYGEDENKNGKLERWELEDRSASSTTTASRSAAFRSRRTITSSTARARSSG